MAQPSRWSPPHGSRRWVGCHVGKRAANHPVSAQPPDRSSSERMRTQVLKKESATLESPFVQRDVAVRCVQSRALCRPNDRFSIALRRPLRYPTFAVNLAVSIDQPLQFRSPGNHCRAVVGTFVTPKKEPATRLTTDLVSTHADTFS